MSQTRALFYFICISFFWGGSFLGIHYVIQNYPPFLGALLRIVVCFIAVGIFMLVKKISFRWGKLAWGSIGTGAIGMGLAWIFLFWGEKHIPPAMASILNGTVPIFIVLLTPLINPHEPIHWQKKLGVLVGFLGMLVVFWPDIRHLDITNYTWGLLSLCCMSLSYGLTILCVRRIMVTMDATANIFYQTLGGAVVLSLVSFLFERDTWTLVDWSFNNSVIAILYLGVFSSAIAFIMFNQLIKYKGSVQASVVTLCAPIAAILLDMIALHSFLNFYQLTGGLFILASLVIINGLVKV